MAEKVVLAYSGGLDTSFCVKYLTEDKGLEVHTAIVQTGGFEEEELAHIGQRALQMGATTHTVLDDTDRFYRECVRFLIYGNVLRYQTYPLSVSAERVFQALAIAEYARKVGARYIAHGSTGAGNDQIRFDMAFRILMPEAEIITPIRDMKLSREAEISYLRAKGVEMNWEKALYSINKGIWGTSVGGKETLTSHLPLPEEAWPTPVSKHTPQTVSLTFEKGELTGLNGQKMAPVAAIQELQKIAQPFGIGRDIHVGDTIIGIKGRVGFEAAAPLIILKAHHALEKHVLTKWQLYWKDQMANWYGMMVHEGQFLDPVMRNIEVFLADTQEPVSGTVHVGLKPYHFDIHGVEAPADLMSAKFGAYGEMNNAWTGEDARGFAKILSNQTMIHHQIRQSDGKN